MKQIISQDEIKKVIEVAFHETVKSPVVVRPLYIQGAAFCVESEEIIRGKRLLVPVIVKDDDDSDEVAAIVSAARDVFEQAMRDGPPA